MGNTSLLIKLCSVQVQVRVCLNVHNEWTGPFDGAGSRTLRNKPLAVGSNTVHTCICGMLTSRVALVHMCRAWPASRPNNSTQYRKRIIRCKKNGYHISVKNGCWLLLFLLFVRFDKCHIHKYHTGIGYILAHILTTHFISKQRRMLGKQDTNNSSLVVLPSYVDITNWTTLIDRFNYLLRNYAAEFHTSISG